MEDQKLQVIVRLNWTLDEKTTTKRSTSFINIGSEKGKILKSEQSDFDEVHSQLFVSPKVTFCSETTKLVFIQKTSFSS